MKSGSTLEKVLASGNPAVTAELGPPMSVLAQRATGQMPPVMCTMQSPQPAQSSLNTPGASTAP